MAFRRPDGTLEYRDYNSRGWLTSFEMIQDSQAIHSETFQYYANGRMGVSSSQEVQQLHGLDALNRVVSSTQIPVGGEASAATTLTTQYNASGYISQRQSAAGGVIESQSSYSYDVGGRLLSESTLLDAQGTTATTLSYSYPTPFTWTITDSNDNTTSYVRDSLGRTIRETIYDQSTPLIRSWEYDDIGNVSSSTDRNGRVIEYEYDHLGRLTDEIWKLGGTIVGGLSYSYNDLGQLFTVVAPDRTESYEYDLLGRVNQTTITTPDAPTVVLNQTYDLRGNRDVTTAKINGVTSIVTDYDFNPLGQVTRIDQSGLNLTHKQIEYRYDANNRLDELERSFIDGAATSVSLGKYTYNDLGQISSLTYTGANNATQAAYHWTYDSSYRIESFNNLVHPTESASYGYDASNQLLNATTGAATASYAYDSNGNRTMSGYVTGANNRLLSDGVFNYAYDNEGNRTSKTEISTGAVTTYAWDHRNRLIGVVIEDENGDPATAVKYAYDANDHVIARWEDNTPEMNGEFLFDDAILERYWYDGDQRLWETHYDEVGDLVETRTYLYGTRPDEILAQENLSYSSGVVIDSLALWQLTDHLQTVRDVVDSSGVLIAHMSYDNFGLLLDAVDDNNDPIDISLLTSLLYTAKPFDFTTGLQENWHRWYDPRTATWLSPDPIQDDIGNTYRYAGNNSPNASDPRGLEEVQARLFYESLRKRPVFSLVPSVDGGWTDDPLKARYHHNPGAQIAQMNQVILGAAAGLASVPGAIGSKVIDVLSHPIDSFWGALQGAYYAGAATGREVREFTVQAWNEGLDTARNDLIDRVLRYEEESLYQLGPYDYGKGLGQFGGTALVGAAGTRFLHAPAKQFGATGTYSGRSFDPSNAGGPIRHLTTDRIQITARGIDVVERHLSRFDEYAPNQEMLGRLRQIASGKIKPSQTDLNFYSHELREYVRYRRQGWQTGVPDHLDARHTLWENAHTATLEDYRLREGPGVLYPYLK